METLLRFPRGWRSKLSGRRKTPQSCAGVRHSMMIWGLLAFCPGFWSTVYAMINCLLTVDTQYQTYTHLTRTFTFHQFHVLTPADGFQLCICMFQSFVTVIQAEDIGLRRTTQLCVKINSFTNSTSSWVLHIPVAWLQSCFDSHYHFSDDVSKPSLTLSPCASLRLQVHSSPELFHWKRYNLIRRCKKRQIVCYRLEWPELPGSYFSLCWFIGFLVVKWLKKKKKRRKEIAPLSFYGIFFLLKFFMFLFFTFLCFPQCWFICRLSKWVESKWRNLPYSWPW